MDILLFFQLFSPFSGQFAPVPWSYLKWILYPRGYIAILLKFFAAYSFLAYVWNIHSIAYKKNEIELRKADRTVGVKIYNSKRQPYAQPF